MAEEQALRQNDDHYKKIDELDHRISAVEGQVMELKADLIGVTGNNGLRGEFRSFRQQNEARENAMLATLNEIKEKQVQSRVERHEQMERNLKWSVATLLTLSGVAVAIMKYIL